LATAPLRLARDLGVPLVLEVNGLLGADAKTMYRSAAEPLGTLIERRKLAMPDAIVTVSTGLADRLAALGANRERIFVVPNSVPDERVAIAPRVAGSSFVVGWIGHLMSWHADALLMLADVAPAVIKRVPEARFRIVGDGPRLPEIRQRVFERGVANAFEFVGAVPYEEVPRALAEFDVGVIPDVFDYAFPVKLVEMGAAGIAVAAPYSHELNAMLRPGVEYQAFTRHDLAALEAAIVALLDQPARRDALAASLHAAVRDRFTWTSAAVGLREVVETALTD
jgi:glycosyltransferase involved in cell wall biosynthesis